MVSVKHAKFGKIGSLVSRLQNYRHSLRSTDTYDTVSILQCHSIKIKNSNIMKNPSDVILRLSYKKSII